MRYEPGHSDRTRKKLLEQAVLSLHQSGPDRTSVADLMSRVGMTNGGFYRHFPSKEHLILEAMDEMLLRSRQRFESFATGVPPTTALSNYIRFYLSTEHVNDRLTGCALPSLSADVTRMSPAAKSRHSIALHRLRAIMADMLLAMGLPRTVALENATSVFVELVGAITLARAAENETDASLILEHSETTIRKRLNLSPSSAPGRVPTD